QRHKFCCDSSRVPSFINDFISFANRSKNSELSSYPRKFGSSEFEGKVSPSYSQSNSYTDEYSNSSSGRWPSWLNYLTILHFNNSFVVAASIDDNKLIIIKNLKNHSHYL
ncbi:hypothetical protein OWV82_016464, partial [Melia azedarach]